MLFSRSPTRNHFQGSETCERMPVRPSAGPRWVRSARAECLNHLVLFGLDGLSRVVHNYKDFFNRHRPHQGIGNRAPTTIHQEPAVQKGIGLRSIGPVHCEQYLGGLLKSYRPSRVTYAP